MVKVFLELWDAILFLIFTSSIFHIDRLIVYMFTWLDYYFFKYEKIRSWDKSCWQQFLSIFPKIQEWERVLDMLLLECPMSLAQLVIHMTLRL